MFCLLDETSNQVCVCIPMAGTSFLDKYAEPEWRWPDNKWPGPCCIWYYFALWHLFSAGEVQLGQNSCWKHTEAKKARRCVSVWISYFNLGELCFAHVTFKGEQRRNDEGMIDIMWLQVQVTKPPTFPHWLVDLSTQDYLSLISC